MAGTRHLRNRPELEREAAAAKAAGIEIPQSIQLRADDIIE
jgi:hypothetical protein